MTETDDVVEGCGQSLEEPDVGIMTQMRRESNTFTVTCSSQISPVVGLTGEELTPG